MKNLKLKTAFLALSLGLGLSATASAGYMDCETAAYLCQYGFDFDACIWQFKNCNV